MNQISSYKPCEEKEKSYLRQYGDLYIEGWNVVKDGSN
jgi:hypothetical protein